MKTFELGIFLVLDQGTNIRNLDNYNGVYKYTLSNMTMFPIGEAVPIIIKKNGCAGLAMIQSFTISGEGTTVTFRIASASDQARLIYYTMYRNMATSSMKDASDVYGDPDMVIPGAMPRATPLERRSDRGTRNNPRYLSDVLAADEREGPYGNSWDDDDD